jgi:2-amino-4-hydroxy-6-hydroxymethyldihydropteridine diphosphokinase
MKNEAVVGLGSNIDPQENISRAFSFLQREFEVLKKSGPVRTSPVGIINQPDFFNAVALLQTNFALDELVAFLKGIENDMGRDRSRPKFGPREIDLDVIIWNKDVVDKDFYERDFLRHLVKDLD